MAFLVSHPLCGPAGAKCPGHEGWRWMPLSLPDGLVVYTTWIGALRKEQSDCKRLRLLFDMLKLQYIDIGRGPLSLSLCCHIV